MRRLCENGRPTTAMTDVPDDAEDPVWGQAMDWLLAVQAAPADIELRARLTAWRAEAVAHERAYRRAERVWSLTGELAPAPAIAPVVPRVIQSDRRRPRRRIVAYGAAVLVAACLLVLLMPMAMLRLEADYLTGAGERRQITLADGTIVDLNADSAVAVDYTPERRDLILLSGEAFVTVGRDGRPFRLLAKDMTVIDIGTAFDVDIGREAYSVAVEHGAVQVTYNGRFNPVDARLGPGDRLRIDRASGAAARRNAAPSQIAAWRQGRLIVEEATIGDVVDMMRRYHRGMIILRDETLAAKRVTGVYDLADPVAALRTAIKPHAGMVDEYTPYVLVVSKR